MSFPLPKGRLEGITPPKVLGKRHGKATEVNVIDLDAHCMPDSSQDEEDDTLTKKLKKKIKRHDPDGEFLPIHIVEDHENTLKIGTDLPDNVKEELVKCLRKDVDLFIRSATDMPSISMDIACHHLVVAQKQSG